MRMRVFWLAPLFCLLTFLFTYWSTLDVKSVTYNSRSLITIGERSVTYDSRSLIINGERKLIISGAIHYPRSVPEMWPGLIKLAKEGGVNAIETYVFWNGHEPSMGQYNFKGRFDLLKFIRIVQEHDLYLILRIGPYVSGEWSFGGIPAWLHYDVPDVILRTDNEPFKYYMQKFMTYIVHMLKEEKLFASQGGPIILNQLENEYSLNEEGYGDGGKLYLVWAEKMALSQNTGVPWTMGKQWDGPKDIINTCHSYYCDQFYPRHTNLPKLWTENWTGWVKMYGYNISIRPIEDVAFSVARFFQKGGSLVNYYMYHGGTNFGRTSAGPFLATSYSFSAPIDEYGLPKLQRWGHFKELHRAIKLCEKALLNNQPITFNVGVSQEVDVYDDGSGTCAAFIANVDAEDDQTVIFRGKSYHLPAWSVSILPDCKNVVYNTAKVGSQYSIAKMIQTNLKSSRTTTQKESNVSQWDVFEEKAGIWADADIVRKGFVNHFDMTKDSTDYLWYTTSLHVDENEDFLSKGNNPLLLIESKGHALQVFVNQQYYGSAAGNFTFFPFESGMPSILKEKKNQIEHLKRIVGNHTLTPLKLEIPISLKAGKNEIALLSVTMGLQPTLIPFYEFLGSGLSSVKIKGLNKGTVELSSTTWSYKIGVQGEQLGLHKPNGLYKMSRKSSTEVPKNQPLTWYKTALDPPPGNEPVALDMLHMGKGQVWLNGNQIGRYWLKKSPVDQNCASKCDYRGRYYLRNCNKGCGEPTQRWYHIPRSWFKQKGNVLVIFEEMGGDPSQIKYGIRKITGLCAHVSEDQPSVDIYSTPTGRSTYHKSKPSVQLNCPANTRISRIKFASFGTPAGNCETLFAFGDCHDPNTHSFVEQVCLNKNKCSIHLSEKNFNEDLCPGVTKSLAVEVECQ